MLAFIFNLILTMANNIKEEVSPETSIRDQLISLLFMNKKIEGRTKFQKIAYLSKINLGLFKNLNFDLHYFGPYSKQLTKHLMELEKDEVITVEIISKGFGFDKEEVSQYNYSLTKKGEKLAKEIMDKLDSKLKGKLAKTLSYNGQSLLSLKNEAYKLWFSH
ncbi:hypothetical protein KY361_03095 [Candidatus Woesearchaeota archaeon]|nr:hypothetical protein [Candidatus Woesearchaeota archaeon]